VPVNSCQLRVDIGTQCVKDVLLTNNSSVPKINSGQFFKSLANNMRSRLFTFQASHSSTADNIFKEIYDELLKDLDVLNEQRVRCKECGYKISSR